MPSLVEDRMAVARAAIASTIADRTGMPLAGTSTAGAVAPGQSVLSLCSTAPAGYPLEAELVPLEIIMRDVTSIESGEDSDPREMTTADHFLEELKAFVNNRLLNPALPIATLTPGVTDTETIDDIYGDVLSRATFAGGVEPDSPRFQEASALLFENGNASAALETYRSYESRIEQARTALQEIPAEDAESRDAAKQQLHRLEAEWIGIGKKLEIEEAFRILQAESESAGFQDERVALLEQYRAGEEKRIDLPGMSYHKVQIVPISPLLDDTNAFWQHVEMDADAVAAGITSDTRAALSLTDDQVHHATDRMQTLTFDFIVCDLLRDWLDPSFFSARYWRLDGDAPPLSDGQGNGRLPALPTRAVFVRGAKVEYEGERSAHPGSLADQAGVTKPGSASMLQIAPASNQREEQTSNRILDAAKQRGLTSSIRLLTKEARRASANAVRKAVAIEPAIATAPETPASRIAPNTTGIVAPAVGAKAIVRPRVIDRITRQAEVVAGQRPRDRSRNRRMRDHRTRTPDREPANGSRCPRVRDHRAPRISITLSLAGSIETTSEHREALNGLVLQYAKIGDDQERTIRLEQATPSRLSFRQQLGDVVREGETTGYHIILRDREGNELDRRLVESDDDEEFTLDWVIKVERIVIELAGQLIPTLHAYGLWPLPACPVPDERLAWP